MPDVELHTDAGTIRLYRALSEGRHLMLVSGAETRAALGKAGIDSFARLVDVADADLRGRVEVARPEPSYWSDRTAFWLSEDADATRVEPSTTCGRSVVERRGNWTQVWALGRELR